jgi:hypothetical protein
MAFDWNVLPVMVDLNKGHAGIDFTGAKGHVDAVQIYMGHPVPGDPLNVYYDPEAANNYERAISAEIPAIGLMVELKPSFWVTDPWRVTLGDVRTQDKSKNPVYMFIEHFFASTRIQADMEKVPISFITFVVDETEEGAVWNMADLTANINHLNIGMKEGKIPPIKIFVAVIPELENSEAWIQEFGTKNAINLFEQYFYHDNVPQGVMVQSQQSKPGTYTWDTLKNCVPDAGLRPVYKSGDKKGDVAYLGAKPNPWFWSHTFGGVYLPNGKGGVIQFGVSSSFYTLADLYNFLGVKAVVPPVEINCDPGYHKDANGNCVPDTNKDCPEGKHWDEASQKCVEDVVPPVNGDFSEITTRLDAILALLKEIFNR